MKERPDSMVYGNPRLYIPLLSALLSTVFAFFLGQSAISTTSGLLLIWTACALLPDVEGKTQVLCLVCVSLCVYRSFLLSGHLGRGGVLAPDDHVPSLPPSFGQIR